MNETIRLTIPLPVAVYAALAGIASADADVTLESLAAFAVRDFVEAYTGKSYPQAGTDLATDFSEFNLPIARK